MSTSFQDKLKEIRDAGTRRTAETRQARSRDDMERSRRTVESLEYREKVEAMIQALAANFGEEAPSFELQRGFYEGKYLLALRADETLFDEDGRSGHYYSRLVFLLSPDAQEGTFGLECRKTIRNRDGETQVLAEAMQADALPALEAFIERHFLAFATAYFSETRLSPTAG